MLISITLLPENSLEIITHSQGSETVPILLNSNIIFGFSSIFIVFLISRFIAWMGGAGYAVISAYISDISTENNRLKNMGMIGAAFGIAFLTGPAISWILTGLWVGIITILILTISLIGVNIMLIIFKLPETITPKNYEYNYKNSIKPKINSNTLSKIYLLLFLSFGMWTAFSGAQTMFAQFYTDKFHFSPTTIGYTLAIIGLVSILYQWFFIKYMHKIFSETKLISVGFAILSISFLGFIYNNNPNWLFFWIIFFPIGMGSFSTALWSLLAKFSNKNVGTIMGYNSSLQSIGSIFWPIIAWFLYTAPASVRPFVFSCIVFIVLFFISLFLERKNINS